MPSPPLVIHLFGPMRVLLKGEPLPRVRTHSVEWLLALLVLRQGRVVERAWLSGTLWPDSQQSQALRNLREDLVRLRKALGDESARLQSPSRDTLTFELSGVEVDVIAFDAAMRTGKEASLRSAVALYTGPLLEGCYEDWVTPERESRQQQCLSALETLATLAEERGEVSEALVMLRRAEGIDSFRDSIQRGLMRVLWASGDTPAALMSYREHRLRLRQEMNAEPDVETTRLFQQVRANGSPRQTDKENPLPKGEPSPEPHARTIKASVFAPLPHLLTALIGREEAVRAVVRKVMVSRLVTLAGTGGVGKTRLAIQVALEAAEQFPQGAAFVTLVSLSDPALLPSFVASALGVREEESADAASLLQALIGWLSTQELLLVLDNCEHLIEAAAQLCQTLLERCPDLHVLATSRQRLGLNGEAVWRVPSLPFPDPDRLSLGEESATTHVLQYPSVQLFAERAQMAKPGFRLSGREDVEAVARICQRLEGIPLAIELAAARAGVLTLPQIVARLNDRFHLLTGGSRGVLTRHQTLRALIDWSYDLLTEAEQALLRRLSVFVGGWTLEAAVAMADLPASIRQGEVLDLLASLVEKSLVLAEAGRPGDLRYRMLETVREYAQEKLRETEAEPTARERHADYFLALAEEAEPQLRGRKETVWLERLEQEHDNLRAALTCLAAQEQTVDKAVRLAAALGNFWNTRGHFYERRTWLVGLALRHSAPTAARAELLEHAAQVVSGDGDYAGAKRISTERLDIWRQLGDRQGIASALNGLAGLLGDPRIAGSEYDPVAARPLAEESLAIMREVGDRQGMAHSLYMLGQLALLIGDKNQARACWRECRAIDQQLSVKGGLVLRELGELALESGDYAAARDYFRAFLTERHEIGERWGVWWSLLGLSELALAEDEPEQAARLLGASFAARESIPHPLSRGDRAEYEARRDVLRQALDESALDTAWAEGYAMTTEQAVTYALTRA